MWNGRKLFIALLLFVSSASPISAQTRHHAEKRMCPDAQIIAIQGEWVAHPGRIPLVLWSCVDHGQDLALDESARSGEITVAYRGSKPPATVSCPTREACRNAYRVEIVDESRKEGSPFTPIIKFFFAFFEGGEPVPVPGILKGTASPQTAVLCRTGDGQIDIAPALRGEPGRYNVLMRPRGISAHFLRWGSGPTLIDDPANRPMLYDLELRDSNNLDQGRALVLVAGNPACEALAKSFQSAVQWTETWPANTPGDAIRNFRAVYLQAIARHPDRAPQE